MIYKSKQSYYTLERRLDKIKKIKKRGFKVAVNKLSFFSETRESVQRIFEGSTGAYIQFKKTQKDLEEVEKILIKYYDIIENGVLSFKKKHIEWNLNNLEEERG